MRFSIWSLTLLLLANLAHAQGIVKLSGKIEKPVSDSVLVSFNTNKIAYYPNEYYAHVDKNGKFSLSFPVPDGVYILADMVHGNRVAELILQAGDSLMMVVNTAHFDSSIVFKGRGSYIANFTAGHKTELGRMNQYTIKLRTAINKEPADFIKNIEQEKQKELNFLNKYRAKLPASFIQFWTAYYQYYNYFFMQQYPQMHQMVKLRRYTDTIPEVNYTVLSEMPYAFSDSFLQVPSYLLYLTGVFDIKLKAAGYSFPADDAINTQRQKDSVNTLAYTLLPDKSAEYFIAQNLYGRAKYQDPETDERWLNTFKKHWPHSEFLPVLDKQVAMTKKLAKGQPAPDLDIITQDGKHLRLSDLKGKVVYLNFWASWCKQCVNEIIRESKIKDLIKNKPVEFVYVSISRDTATDNKIISHYKIDGLFTNVAGEWNAKELQAYGIQNLPAYFLIDEEGNFALQNAPSPAQATQLTLEIGKLLK